ncbi:MAG: autotransporter-associated beta strand repeat-containing protein [Akkermansiaceae bacterium]|nr:autotransporter-associated beta strand repeat-containing protein [Akkermansiaceae bacterium]
MKPKTFFWLTSLVVSFSSVRADDRYWTNSAADGNWQTAANWAEDEDGAGAAVVPAALDDVYFSVTSLTTAQTVSLNGAPSLGSLHFTGTSGTITLQGGGTNRTLTLAGGITVASGAGAVTIGSATSGQNVAVAISGSQSWTNDSPNLLTIRNGVSSSAAGPQTLTIGGSGNTTLGSSLSNGGGVVSLTKTGTGTLEMASSSYTGVTTISGGTLRGTIGNGGANSGVGASGAASENLVFDGGTFDWAGSAHTGINRGFTLNSNGGTIRNDTGFGFRFDGKVTGSGGLTKTGSGSLALVNTTNDYAGITRIVEGNISARIAAALGASTAGNAANGTIIESAGTLILDPDGASGAGANVTFTEHLTLRGGTLSNNTRNNNWSGGIVLEANSILASTSGTLTVNSVIAQSGGTYGITKTGSGTVSLTSNNTFTGVVTISAGTLVVGSLAAGGSASPLGAASSASSNILLDGGTLAFNGVDGFNRGMTLVSGKTSGLSSTGTFRIDGAVVGAGNLNKTGTGTIAFTNAANSYSGVTNVNAGILSIRKGAGTGGNSTLGTSTGTADGTVINSGGTLQFDPGAGTGGAGTNLNVTEFFTLNGGTLRSQSLANTVSSAVALTANSTVAAAATASLNIAAAITESGGSFGINKTDAGTVIISSTGNQFTGTTTVTAGTLSVTGEINSSTEIRINGGTFSAGAAGVIGDAAAVNMTGGVLQFNGFTEILGVLAVTGNAQLALAGANPNIITFGDSSGADWTGGALSITDWNGSGTGGGAERLLFGGGALTPAQLAAITFLNPAGFDEGIYSAKLIGGEVVPDALIPEPAAGMLALVGATVLVTRRRRVG